MPDPDSPVITVNLSRGISTSMFFRLCCRAPRTVICSMLITVENLAYSRNEYFNKSRAVYQCELLAEAFVDERENSGCDTNDDKRCDRPPNCVRFCEFPNGENAQDRARNERNGDYDEGNYSNKIWFENPADLPLRSDGDLGNIIFALHFCSLPDDRWSAARQLKLTFRTGQ